ncbi:hypothetical protein CDAR_11111 [Caerostris darwini]|uniref:Transposase Tc1-like domain-containing protein n=1 Tax=Caerostris darwini TaxID=1538125 RepID=A0AAV4VXP8_9ARAC|nr:hypothetical protein CDAR_11111 [Caerostris darwini]
MLRNRKFSKRILTKHIKDRAIQVAQRTVQRRLAEFGLMAGKPYRKPEFIQAMIKKRLEWARKYFSVEDWERQDCFSGESVFQIMTDKSKFPRNRYFYVLYENTRYLYESTIKQEYL